MLRPKLDVVIVGYLIVFPIKPPCSIETCQFNRPMNIPACIPLQQIRSITNTANTSPLPSGNQTWQWKTPSFIDDGTSSVGDCSSHGGLFLGKHPFHVTMFPARHCDQQRYGTSWPGRRSGHGASPGWVGSNRMDIAWNDLTFYPLANIAGGCSFFHLSIAQVMGWRNLNKGPGDLL